MTSRLRGDDGQVAGIEAVPFGLLILLVGVLVVAHTWAVVDAKFLAGAAARDAARAYVEATAAGSASDGASAAVAAVADGAGRHLQPRLLGSGFERCRLARLEATALVPSVGVPWRPDRPTITVRSEHREIVDPYRDGLPGIANCPPSP